MSAGALRRWHCDLAAGSGEVLWAEFSSIRLGGFSWGMSEAYFLDRDGRVVEGRLARRHPFVRSPGWPRFRGDHLERAVGGFHAAMDLPALRFDLHYHPTARGWVPAGPVAEAASATTGLRWESPDIRALVDGTVDAGSGALSVLGTGYVDRISAGLSWRRRAAAGFLRGRAHFPSETVVFGQFPSFDGGLVQRILLRRDQAHDGDAPTAAAGNCRQRLRWVEDIQFFARASGADGKLVIVHPLFSLTLRDRRILNRTARGGPAPGRPDPLARLIGRFSGAVSRERVAASALLEIGGHTVLGTALYERAQWTSGSA